MRRAALAVVICLAGAASASAGVPAVPQELPAGATAAAGGDWIVGARPGRTADGIAARHRAELLAPGTYVVAAARARELAGDLKAAGVLRFSERDVPRRGAQQRAVAEDPLSPQARWRDVVADPALAPPPVTPTSPRLAIIDSPIDIGHVEYASGANLTTTSQPGLINLHGTATSAVASAPVNGQGIVGIWPGMRVLGVPLPATIRCSDSARAIVDAIEARVAVINMSYGSGAPCYAEYVALQHATARGITAVAAAGNEFADGNPLEYPASLPHVLTVAAVDPRGQAAYFSNENAAIDLSAPGVNILTAVPPGMDPDGTADGYTPLDGTSFAAPIVAAAAAWVRAARPELSSDQLAQVVRLSARDLGREGWDPATGFGMLDVGAALTKEPPVRDPREPNEDIEWVDGRAFGRADRPLWAGGRGLTITAIADAFEDPVDVYRVRVKPRSRLRVTLRPRFGDPDLRVYSARARSVDQTRRRLGISRRTGTRTDRVTVRNRARVTTTMYVVVNVPSRKSLDSVYRLTLKR